MKDESLASSIIKKMFWTIIILIVALVGTNLAWLIYESQFETITSDSVEQEVQDVNNSQINQKGISE